jgi:hypothetical protein
MIEDNIITYLCVTIDWVWIGEWVTTYTHRLELHVITALSLISTLYKSPQHPLSPFQPAESSSAIPWQRLLTVENRQPPALRSFLHSRRCRTQLNRQPSHNWSQSQSQSQSFTLRLAAYRQSVRLGYKPLETHDQ